MTVYGYIRVSTDKQTTENQRFEIEHYLENKNLAIDVWINETISGTVVFAKRKIGRTLKRLKKGDVVICSELSRLGRNILDVMTILNVCMTKQVQVWTVKENYRLGADVNARYKGKKDKTPLYFAFEHNNFEIAKLLIEHGAEYSKEDLDETFLNQLEDIGAFGLVRMMDVGCSLEQIRLQIENGADVNAKDYNGEKPLVNAVRNGNLEIVQLLIEHGADVNAKDNDGKTAESYKGAKKETGKSPKKPFPVFGTLFFF